MVQATESSKNDKKGFSQSGGNRGVDNHMGCVLDAPIMWGKKNKGIPKPLGRAETINYPWTKTSTASITGQWENEKEKGGMRKETKESLNFTKPITSRQNAPAKNRRGIAREAPGQSGENERTMRLERRPISQDGMTNKRKNCWQKDRLMGGREVGKVEGHAKESWSRGGRKIAQRGLRQKVTRGAIS